MARVEKKSLAPEAIENGMKPTTPEEAARGGYGPILLDNGAFERMDGTQIDRLYFRRPNAIDYELRCNWLDEKVPSGTQFCTILSRLTGYPLDELRQMDPLDFADCLEHAAGFFLAFWNRIPYTPGIVVADQAPHENPTK